jgi:hypothetical protein
MAGFQEDHTLRSDIINVNIMNDRKKIKLEGTIRGEGNTNICIPETPKEASHNGKKMAFSN